VNRVARDRGIVLVNAAMSLDGLQTVDVSRHGQITSLRLRMPS